MQGVAAPCTWELRDEDRSAAPRHAERHEMVLDRLRTTGGPLRAEVETTETL